MSWARLWALVWLLLGTSALPTGSRIAQADPSVDMGREESLPMKAASAEQEPKDSDEDEQDKPTAWLFGPRIDVWDGPAARIASTGSGLVLTPAVVGDRTDCPPVPSALEWTFSPAGHLLHGPTAHHWLANRYSHAPPSWA